MDNHWHKMPKSWIDVLTDLPPENLVDLLKTETQTETNVWPLSMLCLRKIIPILSIPREPATEQNTEVN